MAHSCKGCLCVAASGVQRWGLCEGLRGEPRRLRCPCPWPAAQVGKDDLLSMVRYGAELVFSSEATNITGSCGRASPGGAPRTAVPLPKWWPSNVPGAPRPA
jgi:hypothetical protein